MILPGNAGLRTMPNWPGPPLGTRRAAIRQIKNNPREGRHRCRGVAPHSIPRERGASGTARKAPGSWL